MIHRINVILLSLIVAFAPVYIYASNNQIDQAIKKIDDLRNKINNMGIEINKTRKSATGTVRTIADIVNEAGQKQTVARTAVVEQKLNPIKLGQSMMKRIKAVGKGSVPSILGTVAITGLLEGVGWIMEDGTLVKKKEKETSKDDTSPVLYCGTSSTGKCSSSPQTACDSDRSLGGDSGRVYTKNTAIVDPKRPISTIGSTTFPNYVCAVTYYFHPNKTPTYDDTYGLNAKLNPNYKPDAKPEYETIPITAHQLGSAMLGEGYNDPVDDTYNKNINTGDYTSVREAYEADPSGVGNEPNNDLLDRAKHATPTSDGKPAPYGDPRYTNVLKDEKDSSNDRVWNDDGSQATTEPKKDEDGNPTGESTTTFPVFCDWAHVVCDWYDDWKASDQVYKDHIDEEKSFWTKVTDWFDWTKEEPEDEQEQEQPEIDDRGIFSRTFDTVFSLSKQCPPDLPWSIDAYYFKGSYSINLNWLCMIFTFLGYPLVLASHCVGLWIMYEAVIRKEIKW
ncbi:hypothetical protein [Acinetobacter bereziniae]|uniref:hypothetical protein n=1 Tax=Acinetobacter bereziniae TaxID=106648 RepID=UPI003213A0D0